MKTISTVIAELQAIQAEHGDIPVYAFEESGVYERVVGVSFIENDFDWRFPHVQIHP